ISAIERLTGRTFEPLARDANARLGLAALLRAAACEAGMDTLRVWGGRKHKVRPGDLLGALTGEAGGLEAVDIGKIEIHDDFSYVAVAKRVSGRALQSLNRGRIKGKRFRVSRA